MSQFNTQQFNTVLWNSNIVVGQAIPTKHIVFFTTTSIELKWCQQAGANFYQLQVSLTADFNAPFLDTTINVPSHSFTDSQTNNVKRYWRVRASADLGTSYFTRWSEIGSYWMNTAGSEAVDLDRDRWVLFDPDSVTDKYQFDLFPFYSITDQHIMRFNERNRLGELLSEYLTIKASIRLDYIGNQWLDFDQRLEMKRFNEEIKTFFLATYKDGEKDCPVPHIWKVQFEENPELTMIAAGKEEKTQGILMFTEI